MRILYVVFQARLGGHVLSAFTVASEIQSRGHEVMFSGKSGQLTEKIAEKMPFIDIGIPVFIGPRQTYFTRTSWASVSDLRNIIREQKIDIVHAFDAGSYMHTYPACLLENIPVICTICGGVDPYYNLPKSHKIIVFSEEQKNKMMRNWGWPSEKIDIIKNRIDFNYINSGSNKISIQQLKNYGINIDIPLIIMVTSFRSLQVNGIFTLLDSIDIARKSIEFQMVFIGGEDELIQNYAERINKKYEDKAIVFLKPIQDAFRFLEYATVVMGVGRCAFEGMAFSKPTLIIGDKGFAGIVKPQTVENLAYYNFSGRNQDNTQSPKVLAKVMIELLTNKKLQEEFGAFGREYVTQELDVKVGAERIESIYKYMILNYKATASTIKLIGFVRYIIPIHFDNIMHKPRTILKRVFNFITFGKAYLD